MKRVILTLLAAGLCVGSAAAQRGTHSSRPYHHPPARQASREVVRRAPAPAKPAPAPTPSASAAKRAK